MFQGKEIVFFFRDRIQLFLETEDNLVSGIQEQEIALSQRDEIDLFQIKNIAIFRDRRQLGFRDSGTGDITVLGTVYSYFWRQKILYLGFRDSGAGYSSVREQERLVGLFQGQDIFLFQGQYRKLDFRDSETGASSVQGKQLYFKDPELALLQGTGGESEI